MRERMRMPADRSSGDIEDELRDDPAIYALFRALPRALWKHHFDALGSIEKAHAFEGSEAVMQRKLAHMKSVVDGRKASTEMFRSNNAPLPEDISQKELGARLSGLLESPHGSLGAGYTARVKHLDLGGKSYAVKYLLTPTEKTLSSEGEYDMLREVETVTQIEDAENRLHIGERVRVPHPYFFYKNEKLQCYGMQEISGMTFEELLRDAPPATAALSNRRAAVWAALGSRYTSSEERAALDAELDIFMKAVHEVCLHGDIKLGNMMADEEGRIYLIDFGQSVPANSMTENTREQFENIEANERDQVATCVRALLQRVASVKESGRLAA